MMMHGSSASERGGFAYVLSEKDHPAAMMATNFRKIPMGTVTTIGLDRQEFDRRSMADHKSSLNFSKSQTF